MAETAPTVHTAVAQVGPYQFRLTVNESGNGGVFHVANGEIPGGDVVRFAIDKSGKKHASIATAFVKEARPVARPQPTFQERVERLGEGPGTEGLRLFHEIGATDCSKCWELAQKMNRRGLEWSRSRAGVDFCVEHAIERAIEFWDNEQNGVREKMTAWAHSPLSLWDAAKFMAVLTTDKEAALRMLLERLFTEACDRAEAKARETT